MTIKCGVPQGSTLGPFLFLPYINDLNSVFNKAITIHFADDTHLSYSSKKLSTIASDMNCELKKLAQWRRSNKLSINSGKLELVIFHSKTKKELDEITKFFPETNFNYLGKVLDEFLSWDAHISNLCKKLTQTNYILYKVRHYVSQKTCISVYFTLFYSFTS